MASEISFPAERAAPGISPLRTPSAGRLGRRGYIYQFRKPRQNAVLVNDSIYSHSRGYVKGYTILQEGAEGDLYRVTLESRVSVSGIQNDLEAVGLLMTRKHKPRIMVVIPEYHGNRTISEPAAKTEMIKQLLAKGFKVVDQSQTAESDTMTRSRRP